MAALTLAEILEIAKTRTLTKHERTRKSKLLNPERCRENAKNEARSKHREDPGSPASKNITQTKKKAAARAAASRLRRLAQDPDFERRNIAKWREEHPGWNQQYAETIARSSARKVGGVALKNTERRARTPSTKFKCCCSTGKLVRKPVLSRGSERCRTGARPQVGLVAWGFGRHHQPAVFVRTVQRPKARFDANRVAQARRASSRERRLTAQPRRAHNKFSHRKTETCAPRVSTGSSGRARAPSSPPWIFHGKSRVSSTMDAEDGLWALVGWDVPFDDEELGQIDERPLERATVSKIRAVPLNG